MRACKREVSSKNRSLDFSLFCVTALFRTNDVTDRRIIKIETQNATIERFEWIRFCLQTLISGLVDDIPLF